MKESQNSPRKLTALQKAIQACNMRIAGASYAQIAEELKYASPSGARAAVARAVEKKFQQLEESAEEVRLLELERLDQMQVGLWPKAVRGHEGAIQRQLQIMERRAKYTGADRPTKVELSGEVSTAADDIDFTGWTTEQLARYDRIERELEALLAETSKNAENKLAP